MMKFTDIPVGAKLRLKNGKIVTVVGVKHGEYGVTYEVTHTDYNTHEGRQFFVRPAGIAKELS